MHKCGCIYKATEMSIVDGKILMEDYIGKNVGCDYTGPLMICMNYLTVCKVPKLLDAMLRSTILMMIINPRKGKARIHIREVVHP